MKGGDYYRYLFNVDDEGNFLNRHEAAIHAYNCKQIDELYEIIISEMLW